MQPAVERRKRKAMPLSETEQVKHITELLEIAGNVQAAAAVLAAQPSHAITVRSKAVLARKRLDTFITAFGTDVGD